MLLLNSLDILPLAPQILLPQRDLVIPTASSQHVATQRPADAPNGRIEVQDLDAPLAGRSAVARPDSHGPILRGAGDVALLQHGRAPGHVAHPVGVARQRLSLEFVAVCGRVKGPDFERIVRSSGDESSVACGAWAGGGRDDASGGGGGGPGDGVDAETVGVEDGVLPRVVAELEDGNVAI